MSLSGSRTFAATVAHGISVGSWKTKPIPSFSLPPTGCRHSTRPLLGSANPAIMRSAVDLPHPEGPSRDRNSPGCTSISRLSSARTPLANTLPTALSVTSAVVIFCFCRGCVGWAEPVPGSDRGSPDGTLIIRAVYQRFCPRGGGVDGLAWAKARIRPKRVERCSARLCPPYKSKRGHFPRRSRPTLRLTNCSV